MTDWAVVHVITKLELGGAQLATLYEVSHGNFGRDARFLVSGPGGLLDEEARELEGVEFRHAPSLRREVHPLRDARALAELVGLLREVRRRYPGRRLLVHTHSSKAGILGRWAGRLAGVDLLVHTAHGFGHSHHGSRALKALFSEAERLTGRVTTGFTADSAANIHQGRLEGLFGDAPARVVRCGIDVDAFSGAAGQRERLRGELGIGAGETMVLNLSCLKPQKDPVAFVEVAARVVAEDSSVVFALAGDGELRPEVEGAVVRHGLGDNFRVLGWRRDAPDLLAAADILMLTSRWEGLPQVFAQAMAAGRPIVATAVDGAPEAITHGENGLLTPSGDERGLAGAVLGLVRDPERRARMGQTGRERVGPFSQEAMVESLESFYRELAEAG